MEFHCLPVFLSLNLMLITAHAALTPRLYWETMLPSTPMPKAITELLSLGGGDVCKGHMQMLNSDDQSQSGSIFEYAGHTQDEDVRKEHNMQIFKRLFFLEEDMLAGKTFNMQFNKTKPTVPLLPRQISKQIPFSLEKKKQALAMLGVEANSSNAKIMAETIGLCEEPATDSERKRCATSLEDMVDFVVSALGKDVGAFSTEKERETESEKFVVMKNGVRRLGDDKVIACHPMSYPYVVFGCHLVPKSSGYLVGLEGEDGVRVKAVVACHRDTSKWDHNHVAFKVLNVKPGNGTVCHVFTEGNLLWLPK